MIFWITNVPGDRLVYIAEVINIQHGCEFHNIDENGQEDDWHYCFEFGPIYSLGIFNYEQFINEIHLGALTGVSLSELSLQDWNNLNNLSHQEPDEFSN